MFKRIPLVALLLSVAVVLSSAFAVAPIRDAATHADMSEAYLTRSMGYVMLAPLSNVLDTLTLLSKRQHIALVLGVIVIFAVWRLVSSRRRSITGRQHLWSVAAMLIALLATYAAAAALPRPMATLVTDNANIARIDFHSHTAASHDGRPGWSAEDLREWHREGGYDVAYITDHATVASAEQGMARNPTPAGEGVTILQGIEVTWNGEHVDVLGAQRVYKGILTPNLRDVDEQGLRLASAFAGREPVVIWNHPRQLNPPRVTLATGPQTFGVRGIEVANGAPNSIDDVQRERAGILALAETRNLTMTGGSDNHGWGSVAPSWTLMLLVGWRAMDAEALSRGIEATIRQGGVAATKVVERRVADPTNAVGVVFTVVTAPARMLTTVSNDERLVWLVWIWILAGAGLWLRRKPKSAEV
ncbi:MAG TPA: hypothetical protein VFT29_07285 [Gemmatimonadaceae bacterium]|nr:hypothetical protein [Gemmatimonadaceae bacterium]